MILFANKQQAERLKGYSIIRTKKFLITLRHGWKKSSIEAYLNDIIEPFVTFIKGAGLILLSVFQLIKMLYMLLPSIIFIKEQNKVKGEYNVIKIK